MTPFPADVVNAAGFARSPALWTAGRPVLVVQSTGGGLIAFAAAEHADVPAPWQSARFVLESRATDWVVYPSGLALPLPCVNWIWEYPDDVRQGNAAQAVRYALKRGIDPDRVWPVDPDRVHGTYVRYEGARPDGRDYQFRHARAFPSRVGV